MVRLAQVAGRAAGERRRARPSCRRAHAARTPAPGRSARWRRRRRPGRCRRRERRRRPGRRAASRRRSRSTSTAARMVPAAESDSVEGTAPKTDAASALRAVSVIAASSASAPRERGQAEPGRHVGEHDQEAAPADQRRGLVEEGRRRRDVEGDEGRHGDGEDRADGERRGRNRRRQGRSGGAGEGGRSLQGCLTVTGDAIRLGSRWRMRVLASKRGMIRAPSSKSR